MPSGRNPLPAEAEMDKVYAVAYKEFEDATATFNTLQGDLNKVSADIKAFENQLKSSQAAVQRLLEKLESDNANLASSLEKVGLEMTEGLEQMISNLVAETEAVIAQNNEKIKEGEKLDKDVALRRDALEKARTKKEQALKQLNDADSKLQAVTQSITTIKALIKAKKSTSDQAVEQIETSVAGFDGIDIDWKQSPDSYAAALKRQAGAYVNLCEKVRREEQNLVNAQRTYDALIDVVRQIAKAMPEWQDVQVESKVAMSGAAQKANAVLAESNAYKGQLAEKISGILENERLIDEFLESQSSIDKERLAVLASVNAAQIGELNKGLEQTRAAIVAANSALEEHNKTYNALQATKPEIAEEDTPESLKRELAVRAEQLGKSREDKGVAEQKLLQIEEDRKKRGTYESQVAMLQADYDKWARLCSYFGDSKGAKFRKIAQSYILANLIRVANVYMSTLTNRYTLTVEPGEFVIMVEDAYQGFAKRAASTISGGESFLVSLSLALALSDIGHTLAVDILFIDEGFGSLSGDTLGKAIDTLRTLHRKSGRKVGIISHVEELKAKVPVQIVVEQEGNSSRSTIKVV